MTQKAATSPKTHSSRGDSSQKLEPWGSLHGFQEAQHVGVSPLLSGPYCLYNLGEGGTCEPIMFQELPETCALFFFFLSLNIRGNCPTIRTVVLPETLSCTRFLALAQAVSLSSSDSNSINSCKRKIRNAYIT